MNPENTETLFRDFPELFPPQAMNERTGLMGYGFSHGDGWYDIVRGALVKLDRIRATLPEDERAGFWVFQVKEKFGTIRIYLDRYPKDEAAREAVSEAIDEAERLSGVTCEVCGLPGTLRPGGWLRTLCDEHAKDRPSPWDDEDDDDDDDGHGKG